MSCISSVSSAVLVNGSPTEKFDPSRGIRQGDPLSPYVFIICMEILSKLILQSTQNGLWKPYSLGANKTQISHLLFADDILLCGEATPGNALTVQNILDLFCQLSGQTISQEKSRILFSANTDPAMRLEVMDIFRFKETEDLSPYLGFPLLTGRPKMSRVKFIVDKMRSKLSNWKAGCLSKAGRLTLINSTLNSIPCYYMQVLPLPVACTKKMNAIMRDFLWGKGNDEKGLHLVNWESITRPKEEGGLGIRCCTKLNRAHSLKLWWKIVEKKENLAVRLLKDKYFKQDMSMKSFNSGSFIWKGLGKVWGLFEENLQWGLGNGEKMSVWSGSWLNGHKLRDLLIGPLPKDAEALTLSNCYVNGCRDDTILSFPIPPHIDSIWRNVHFSPFSDFSYSWFTVQGKFSFNRAMQAQLLDHPMRQDLRWCWQTHTPPKIQFFLWLCSIDRIPHRSTLFQRNITPTKTCPICSQDEDTDHILRSCSFAKEVWDLHQPGMQAEFFSSPLSSWLEQNCNIQNANLSSTIIPWHTLFPFILWSLWLRRNDLVFSNISSSSNACLDKAKALALDFYLYQSNHNAMPQASSTPNTWQPPPIQKWMLNVDASFSSRLKLSGIGGVIRDHHGTWIKGFQKSCAAATVLMAELLAILFGLKLLQSMNSTNVLICSDSINAIRLLEEVDMGRDENANIVRECRQLIQELQVTLMHTRRQSNQLSDALAKHCRINCNSLVAMTILEQPLDEARLLYEEEKPP